MIAGCPRSQLLPDHIDRDGDCFWRHAGVVIAGLKTQPGLDQVIAGLGHDARLDSKLAGVDTELGLWIDWQRKISAEKVVGMKKSSLGVWELM